MKQQPSLAATLGRVTDEVRRILRDGENEPVGVLSAYRNSILKHPPPRWRHAAARQPAADWRHARLATSGAERPRGSLNSRTKRQ